MKENDFRLNAAKALIGTGRVSRRDFVQLGLAAGLAAAASESLFGAARAVASGLDELGAGEGPVDVFDLKGRA